MCNRDKELLKMALEGDIGAFEELLGSNQRKIYNLCYRMMRNEQDAEDMSQEAFVKAFRSLRKFSFRSTFSTWLYRIAVNTCLDELRRRKKKTVSIDALDDMGMSIGDDSQADIAGRVALKNDITSALYRLDDKDRMIVILKDVQGNSYEDIAGILGCPIGTVRSRLSRARAKLAQICIQMELYPDSYRQNICKEAR